MVDAAGRHLAALEIFVRQVQTGVLRMRVRHHPGYQVGQVSARVGRGWRRVSQDGVEVGPGLDDPYVPGTEVDEDHRQIGGEGGVNRFHGAAGLALIPSISGSHQVKGRRRQ